MKTLLVDTDLGHDPDDFFALCYLIAAKANIQGITIHPGDPDQIAIAKLLCQEVGLNIPITAAFPNRKELSSGSIHHELLKLYGKPLHAQPDGIGTQGLPQVSDIFVIGPATTTAQYLKESPVLPETLLMQGGFLPYNLYLPSHTLNKFEGKQAIRTFNMCNDPQALEEIVKSDIPTRRFVGKNVCHTIEFNKETFQRFPTPSCRASELFAQAAQLYFKRQATKKFHDPTAAVCLLHPEIGTWIRGSPQFTGKEFTTKVNPPETGPYILADLDRKKLWDHLSSHT